MSSVYSRTRESPIDTLLVILEDVRQTAKGQWLCRCPAHHDKSASLSVRELETGKILIHCFAGCDTQEILSVLGLEFTDLYPIEDVSNHSKRPKSNPLEQDFRRYHSEADMTFLEAYMELREVGWVETNAPFSKDVQKALKSVILPKFPSVLADCRTLARACKIPLFASQTEYSEFGKFTFEVFACWLALCVATLMQDLDLLQTADCNKSDTSWTNQSDSWQPNSKAWR
jgi:hypothetical protein